MASASETLGQEFFTQAETAISSDAVMLMYANLVQVFREEIQARNGSVIDLMLGERAAFLYAYMRDQESSPNAWQSQSGPRNRREMMKDLIDLLLQIKKLWASEDRNDQSDKILAKVNKAVFDALKDMPEKEGKALQRDLATAFEAHGL